jgi:hypothetical protein
MSSKISCVTRIARMFFCTRVRSDGVNYHAICLHAENIYMLLELTKYISKYTLLHPKFCLVAPDCQKMCVMYVFSFI